ncbi:MAG TPA: N-acetyltransferase [Caulobacteraceae bacterium]|jgi:ribosomal protein S18 acetylase RimI-like enzyme|nr:N-acetyltransferase [Caulobacteraceae bacterium]
MNQSYSTARPQGYAAKREAVIRRAVPADAQALAAIGAATFAETFAHLYPPEDLQHFLSTAHSVEAAAADLADPTKAIWLVEADGRTIGYAFVGPCDLPHHEVTPACGELKRIYVEKASQGGGLGARLMDVTLAWLERDGPRRLWIGVWSQNLGAQKLYQRYGFEKIGEYEFKVGASRDHEFIMRRG